MFTRNLLNISNRFIQRTPITYKYNPCTITQSVISLRSIPVHTMSTRDMSETTTTSPRGAFVVFEGMDRAGKTSQVELLGKYLASMNVPVKMIRFPDRSTPTGQKIDSYLRNTANIDDLEIHRLFAENRHEVMDSILQDINQGTTVICDRYSYSGIVYTVSKGTTALTIDTAAEYEYGLPSPDLVIFCDLTPEAAATRGEYGLERYENVEFQSKVRSTFHAMIARSQALQKKQVQTAPWAVIDCSGSIESIHENIKQVWKDHVQTRIHALPPVYTYNKDNL